MRVERSNEYETRVRAVRKRLALDFRPLKDTLTKGLDVLVDPEAAVYCTATVEALCDAIFCVVIKHLHDDAAAGNTPLETKVTVSHLQLALRSDCDLAEVLARVDGATSVLECFLDDATSRILYARQLLATPDAKHLRPSPVHTTTATLAESTQNASAEDDELIALHARTRAEWQRREDDPFSDVDFAAVLKCAHPAFTLSYNATALLSALVRELLNAVCDLADIDNAQLRIPPELLLSDVDAPLAQICHAGLTGERVKRTACDVLERFRLQSRKGATLTLRFTLLAASGTTTNGHTATGTFALGNIARDTPFTELLPRMCKQCRTDANTTLAVYRNHAVDLLATPATLSMPTGAVVFLAARKWWDHTRRNEARRGLLSSLRPQDASLKSLVDATASRVLRQPQTQQQGAARAASMRGPATTASLRAAGAASLSSLPLAPASPIARINAARRRRRTQSDPDDAATDSLARLVDQQQPPQQCDEPVVDTSNNHSWQMLAASNAQLLATLDTAWLGFAAISGGARSLHDRLNQQLAQQRLRDCDRARDDDGASGELATRASELDLLEVELQLRLEKTDELVAQTRAAKRLAAQLVAQVQRARQEQRR